MDSILASRKEGFA
jgi:hypothetical protein